MSSYFVPPVRTRADRRPGSYAAVASVRLRAILQYRAAALAAVATQVFWGLLRLMILDGFYRSDPGASDFSTVHLVSYVWLGQALFGLFPMNVDPLASERIRSGAVAYELLRPLDLYANWGVSVIGWRIGRTALRAVPLLLFAAVLLPLIGARSWALDAPASVAAALGFAVAIALGVLTGMAITLLGQTIMLWTLSSTGWNAILPLASWICSGMVVPLPYLPDVARTVLELLPFAGLIDTPFRIYSGHLAGAEALRALLVQAAWVVALVAAGHRLMGLGIRKVVIQGG